METAKSDFGDEKMASEISVTTYNILSPDQTYALSGYDNDILNPMNRLRMILERIKEWVSKNRVIALQEVNEKWSSSIQDTLIKSNYTAIYGARNFKTPSRLGTLIAVPNDIYIVNSMRVTSLQDITFDGLKLDCKTTVIDTLHIPSGKTIAFASYHAPLSMKNPQVRFTHVITSITRFTADYSKSEIQVFMGDLNCKPKDKIHAMIKCLDYNKYKDEHTPTNIAMNSGGRFCDRLDYVYVRGNCEIKSDTIEGYSDLKDPSTMVLPNACEPSDHLAVTNVILI